MTTHVGREFNPNSPKQLQQVMYYELKFPVIGKVSTDRATLLELKKHEDHPFLDCLLQYRQISKLHSTYVKGIRERLDDKDLLHASFNLHTTVTGRLSSSNPNLQNIPARGTKDIRNLFVANERWRFLEVDFSQAEIRCLAWYSDDENLLQILREGGDLHRKTAALVFNKPEEEVTDLERHIGKTLNFAVLYGAGPGTVMDTVLETVPDAKFTYGQAKRAINDWFRAFPGAAEWIRGVQENVLITKEVSTPLGRRRRFDLLTPETTPEVQRQAVNTPIQSLASDLCLLSLINLSHKSTRAFPLITVHDSILLEFPEQADPLEVAEEVEDIIQAVVKEVLGDKVPFVVDFAVGSRWGDLEELEVVHNLN